MRNLKAKLDRYNREGNFDSGDPNDPLRYDFSGDNQQYLSTWALSQAAGTRRRLKYQYERMPWGNIDGEFLLEQYNLQGARCYLCGKSCTFYEIQIEHLLPVSRGGANTKGNVRLACKRCNSRKGTNLPPVGEGEALAPIRTYRENGIIIKVIPTIPDQEVSWVRECIPRSWLSGKFRVDPDYENSRGGELGSSPR